MNVDDTPRKAAARSFRVLHPLIMGVVTASYSLLAVWGLLVAAFADVAVLGGAVVAIPLGYVVLASAITRATTGRAHVWWNIALTATLVAFGVTIGLALPPFGGPPALPLALGLAAAVSSLVVMPRAARFVGIAAIAAQLVIVFIPLASSQVQVGQQQAAEDATELARRNEMNTRPYVVPGLVVQIVLPTDYQTDVKLSRDADAPSRESYQLEDSDITLSTAPLTAGQSIDSEACRSIRNPDAGGSPQNVCRQLDADTWLLDARGERSIVRIRDGVRIEISDGRADTSELEALLDEAQLMTVPQFEEWNSWLFERDKRV
ncbi:hypothetical protein ACEXQE_06470 [Herbiconiux sp. P17]|uniref:hypothetical protein n=1 Tax=Herbiconiux wuyangfengii TaxID=3342794 RepID=UPI0035BA9A5F